MAVVQLVTARADERRRSPLIPRWGARLSGVVLVLVVWQLLSSTGIISSRSLAGPSAVLQTAWDLAKDGTLATAMWASLQRVLFGLALGIPIGTILALITGLFRLGENIVDAPMQALRFVPVIGLQPLIILWFGIDNTAKIALLLFGIVFPIYINTSVAILQIDRRYLELGRTLGLSRLKVIRRILLPAALPSFMVGLRFAVQVAWLLLVFAEQINASNGIGYLMVRAQEFFQADVIVACLAVYAVLGLVSDVIVRLIEKKALAWLPN